MAKLDDVCPDGHAPPSGSGSLFGAVVFIPIVALSAIVLSPVMAAALNNVVLRSWTSASWVRRLYKYMPPIAAK